MTDETQAEPLAGWIEEIARRSEGLLTARIIDLQAQCRDEFARRRGWIVGREFSTEQLKRGTRPSRQGEYSAKRADPMIYDHVNYFRAPKTGKPLAFITHSYSPAEDIRESVERDGLAVEWLAESWYYPGQCTAALITAPRRFRSRDARAGQFRQFREPLERAADDEPDRVEANQKGPTRGPYTDRWCIPDDTTRQRSRRRAFRYH